MKRVVFYIRVSTDGQEKSETPENQLRDLYKIYNKSDVVKIYEDTGSGADRDRRGLTELRKDAQKKLFDVVAVWDTSRLARDILLALTLRDEFKALGIKIEVMGRERDDSDDAKIYTLIESWMDERERAKIKSRFVSGRERRLSEGKLIGCYPPYGYNHIRRNKEKGTDARLEINEPEARIVRLVFKWYIELESIFMVAQRLREKKILTRGRNGVPRFFQTSSLSRMLKRETYIGNQYFGKSSPCQSKFHIYKNRKYKLTGRKLNPKSEWRCVKVPAIIDKDIFEKAQVILIKRAKFVLKETKHQFLCQGVIKCVDCNRNYGGRMQGGALIYRCPQHFNSNLNNPTCRSRSMMAHKLDNAVWNYVKSLISDRDRLKNNINLLKEKRESDRNSNTRVLEALRAEKASLKIKNKRLFELYSSDPEMQVADLKDKMNEFTEREKSIDSQITQAENELKDIQGYDSAENEVDKICNIYRSKIDNPTFELKKYIVRKWIEEIRIEKDGTLRISVRVPQLEKGEDFKTETNFSFRSMSNLLMEGFLSRLRFQEVICP
ncbi:MAG: recombinase family protein [Candidatus Staskawiczbacteria bacterium]|jgi:site-specific DNA recombinase